MPDKWSQYAQPASSGDKWAQYAAAASPDSSELPPEPPSDSHTFSGAVGNVMSRIGSNIVGMVKPFTQSPAKTMEDITSRQGSVWRGEKQPDIISDFANTAHTDVPKAFENLAGDVGTAALVHGVTKLPQLAKVPDAIRGAAMGDPNAAALRGLQIGPKSPKTLSTLRSVEGARPFLQGAQSLEDLQSKIPQAKSEIWAPYQQAVDAIGDRPVRGPDGMTTVGELEKERVQLSALNRDLKSKMPNPESVQLAQQKGLNQAQLLAKEKAVKMALMPELATTGIDPKAILKVFGQVSDVGSKISGKSTLIEPYEPSGFGKIAKLSLEKPLQAPGQIWEGFKDIAAGRPLFQMKPTDVALREAFRTAGPKPNLGQFQMPIAKGLLPEPQIQLGGPPEVGGTPEGYRPPPVYADTTPMRTGRLLKAPPIQLPGAVEGARNPIFHYDTTPMRQGRLLPQPEAHTPMSSYTEEFPEQLPGARIRGKKVIEGRK